MPPSSRRQFLRWGVATGSLWFAGCRESGEPDRATSRPTGSSADRETDQQDRTTPRPTESGTDCETGEPESATPPPTGSRTDCERGRTVHESNASISDNASWPMVQYDAGHSGYNPDATVPENVTTRWRYTACTGIDGIVTVADGSVVPGRAVLNGRTGERSAGELTSYQRPAVVDGTLFVGSHALEAYDPADLTPRWTFETEGDSGGVSAPTVADGTVYVAGNVDDRTVYAVDAADGSERWRFTPNHEHNTPVAVDGDSVYLVDHAGVLYCLDAASGTERWRYRGGNETFYRPPIAVDGQVYVALNDGAVVAVAGADGAERWRTDTADRGEVALAVAEDTVYVGASDACLALDRADGTERWRADCVSGGACSVASNAVVFGGDETLTALSRTDGSELWSFETRSVAIYNSPLSGIPFAPALVDNSVFVATEGSDIYALGSAAD